MTSHSISSAQPTTSLPSINSAVHSRSTRARGDCWGAVEGSSFRWEYQMLSDRNKVLKFDRRPQANRPDLRTLSGPLSRFNPYKRMVLPSFRAPIATTTMHMLGKDDQTANGSSVAGPSQRPVAVLSSASTDAQQEVTVRAVPVGGQQQSAPVLSCQLDTAVERDPATATVGTELSGLAALSTRNAATRIPPHVSRAQKGAIPGHLPDQPLLAPPPTSTISGTYVPPTMQAIGSGYTMTSAPSMAGSTLASTDNFAMTKAQRETFGAQHDLGRPPQATSATLNSRTHPTLAMPTPTAAEASTSADTMARVHTSYEVLTDDLSRGRREHFSTQRDVGTTPGCAANGRSSSQATAVISGSTTTSTLADSGMSAFGFDYASSPSAGASLTAPSDGPGHLQFSNAGGSEAVAGTSEQDLSWPYETTSQYLNPEDLVGSWFSAMNAYDWNHEAQS